MQTTTLTPVEIRLAVVRDPLVVTPETSVMDALAQMSGVRSCNLFGAESSTCGTQSGLGSLDTLLRETRSSCVVVVEHERVVGILTERDIVRLSAQRLFFQDLTLRQIATHAVVTLRESALTNLFVAVNLLQQNRIRHLPIVDDRERLVGLLTHESLRQLSQPIDLLRLRLVEEVMTREVICASPDCSMLEIAQLMAQHHISSVMIVEAEGRSPESFQRPIGIVTERDLVQFQVLGLSLERCKARSMMSAPIFTVNPDESLLVVQQIMEQRLIRRLAVVDKQGTLLGIVTQTNLLQALNPLEIYKLAEVLEKKVVLLEAEKVTLLQSRTVELEQQVELRTIALKAKAEREKLLTALSIQIRASLSLQTILDTTVEQVRQVLGCDRVNIWQFGADWQSIVVAESTCSSLSLVGKQINDICFKQERAELYRQGHVRIISDIHTTEMSDCHREMLLHLQTRAKILVPLLSGNELWGLLNVTESQHPRDWQPEEVELLQALSEQLTIALKQAINHQQLQEELLTRQQTEALLKAQNEILAKIAKDPPLEEILNALIDAVEHSLKGAIGSVLLLGSDNQLHFGAAPNLPPEFNRAVDGLSIGDEVGSCGTAAFRQEAVIVSDIETEPLWQNHKDFTLGFGLQACWAFPIMSSDGRVLGTFGVYYKAVRSPQLSELESLQRMANIAAIAIERKQTQDALQSSEIRWQFALEGAGDGVWDWNVETNQVFLSHKWKEMLGYADHEVGNTIMEWDTRAHPDDKAYCYSELQKHFSGEIPIYQAEHRMLCKDGSYKWILARGKVIEWTEAKRPQRIIGTHADISDRKRAEEQLQNLIEVTAATTGEDFFPALVSHITKVLNVPYAVVAELVDQRLQTLAFCSDRGLQTNFTYPLGKTPCERAIQDGTYYCEVLVQERFPDALALVELGAQSYLGVALRNNQGKVIGNLCILDTHPIQDQQRAEQVLRVFAARATAELERERAIQALEHLNQELESKVKNRTAALEISEKRYRALMDGASDAILLADVAGNLIEVNQKAEALLGYSREELTCLHISKIHPAGAFVVGHEHFKATVEHNFSPTLESSIVRKDFSLVPVEMTASRIELESGQVIQGIIRDISDRKKAEAELSKSRQKYYSLIQSVNGIVWEYDLRTDQFMFVSNKAEELLGYPIEAWLTETNFWKRHVYSEDIVRAEQYFDTAIQCKKSCEMEYRMVAANGSLVWVYDVSSLHFDDQGNPTNSIGVIIDICDRKRSEAKINQQIATIEAAIDGIGIMQDYSFIYLNQAHLSLFGYENSEELLGKSWMPLYPPEEVERVERTIFPQLMRDGSWQGEATAMRKNGSTFAQGLSLSITEDGLIICVCRDISEQKAVLYERQQAEAKLQQTNEELARATRLKDEFLANMSHELRTPLNAILGMTEGLQDRVFGEINQPQDKALQTISRSAAHLLELINDILDVAKIESGQIELEYLSTNVALLCRSSLSFIKQQALKKRIQVETKLPLNLADLIVDERRIRQVLINLLNNAVKFTPEDGSITIEVSREPYPSNGLNLTPSSSETFLYISVIDTGIGIAPEQIHKLFKPFIQIDSALNRQYTGTGLGLALAKQIVELHGGQVGLRSEVGIGSCFTIALPYLTSAPSLPAPPASFSNGTEVAQMGQKIIPLILLAEDNESNIITISSYLGAKGYDLMVATNGREAITMAQAKKPDLILMDIQMPEIDGLEAIRQIRSSPELTNIPIIALTALAMIGDRERCLAAGANDYISKPIKLKHLVTTIQQLLFA